MWIIYTAELGHFPENTLIKIPWQNTQFGSDSSELRSTDMDVIYLFILMFCAADTSAAFLTNRKRSVDRGC